MSVCEVMGNFSGGRLFYAGVHMGCEVCLWNGYYAAVNALKRLNFELTLHGFIMACEMQAEPEAQQPAAEITFKLAPQEDTGSFHTNARVEAYLGDERIGACNYHFLKRLSQHLGRGIGQITIAVDERYHRRKIGSALQTRAHRELFRLGARKVILATNYRVYPAIKMYEKLGYRKELVDLFMFTGYLAEEVKF